MIAQVRRTHPDTAVIILTMHNAPAGVRELIDSGAAAYLVKSIADLRRVAQAIAA